MPSPDHAAGAVRRIAYLNPYLALAEDQAFQSLRAAAAGMGVELVSLLPSDLDEGDDYDFVISTTSAVRKTTSHPTFLSAHTPRALYVDTEEAFANTASYDGWLCISDNLTRFFSDLAHAVRAPLIEPGAYYNCPQKLDLTADIPAASAKGELALCYFGTNWDSRAARLFQRLAAEPTTRIYGPERSWQDLPPGAYKGSVPFDGVSVQREYARYGVGLVCLSEEHLLDDIVSNRVFEISSVGACSICPDTPWMRANFGDAVYYYDAFSAPDEIARQVAERMAEIAADPQEAQRKGRAARAVFETRFSAEVMLANAIDYFHRWQAASQARLEGLQAPVVDIIVRTGGRDLKFLERALASVDRQSFGRFRIILVRYKPVDLEPVLVARRERIEGIEVVDEPGGNRSRTLVAGLAHVRSPWFALLDDDDYLLSDHFANLAQALGRSDASRRFAYSDILTHDEGKPPAPPWDNGRKILKEGPAFGDIHTLLQRFSPHCFVASSRCLEQFDWRHWVSETAEDVLLISNLLSLCEPVHAAGATCVYSIGREGTSNYLNDANRIRDELTLVTSISHIYRGIESKFPATPQAPRDIVYPVMRRLMEQTRERVQQSSGRHGVLGQWQTVADRDPLEVISALVDEVELVCVAVPLNPDRATGHGDVAFGGAGLSVTPKDPWELSVTVQLADYQLPGCTAVAAICLAETPEAVSFGLVDQRFEMVRKVVMPATASRLVAAIKNLDGAPLLAAALQAGAKPSSTPLAIEAVWIGYPLEALRQHFARPDLAAAEAVARLEAALQDQVLGTPPPDQAALAARPVNFRTPRCVFRGAVSDGPFTQGAVRTLHTGAIPWDYFCQVHIPADHLAGCDQLHVQLSGCGEAFYLMLVDETFSQVLSDRFAIRKSGRIDVWFDCSALTGAAYLVFQAGETTGNAPLKLHRVETLAGPGET